MSTHSFSDDDDDASLAQLEAQEKAYAAQLEALQAGQGPATITSPDPTAASQLAAENARLKAQLAALESASAVKSTTKRNRELAKQQEMLDKMAAENAKLSKALATGVDLSKVTGLRSSASDALAASKARSVSLVRVTTQRLIARVKIGLLSMCRLL